MLSQQLDEDGARALNNLSAASKVSTKSRIHLLGLVLLYDSLSEAKDYLKTSYCNTTVQDWMLKHGSIPRVSPIRKSVNDPEGSFGRPFPGQGSQYVNMGCDLTANFPPLRTMYSKMDALFLKDNLAPLSSVVFPPPAFNEGEVAASNLCDYRLQIMHRLPLVFSAPDYSRY